MKALKDFVLNSKLLAVVLNGITTYLFCDWLNILSLFYVWLGWVTVTNLAAELVPYLPKTWVIHYCNSGEERYILRDGFNHPTAEEDVDIELLELYGQRGEDVVSGGFIKLSPIVKMRQRIIANGDITPIYIKTKVTRCQYNSMVTSNFFMSEKCGDTWETITPRNIMNESIKSGECVLERPKHFYSWTHIVLMLAGFSSNETINRVIKRSSTKHLITI